MRSLADRGICTYPVAIDPIGTRKLLASDAGSLRIGADGPVWTERPNGVIDGGGDPKIADA